MLLRTHLVFSFFIWILVFDYLASPWIFLFFMFLATFFVDIDCRKSKFGRNWYFRPLQWFVKHRGIFHTIIFGFFLSCVIYFFNCFAGYGFFWGYLFHLFLDMFTRQGIMLFYPISFYKIGFGLKSGGLIEEILFVLLFLFDILLIILKLVF